MISYEPFHRTLKKRNIKQTHFIEQNHLSPNLISRINHNEPMSTKTIDKLCKILECPVSDIIEFRDPNISLEDTEFDFIINYVENTDFRNYIKKSKIDNKSYMSNDMSTLRSLYQAYCAHHNIKYDDLETTELLLYKIWVVLKTNKTYPYKHFQIFRQHMYSN